jgi:hypothetical protein
VGITGAVAGPSAVAGLAAAFLGKLIRKVAKAAGRVVKAPAGLVRRRRT